MAGEAEVEITATLIGVDEVASGFQAIAESNEEMTNRINVTSSELSSDFSLVSDSSVEMVSEIKLGSSEFVAEFDKMSVSANWLGNTIENEAEKSNRSMLGMATGIRNLGVGVVAIGKLGEAFGLLNAEQTKVLQTLGWMVTLGGSVVRALNAITSASWLVTAAEKARAIAHSIANALSGPWGWAILASSVAITAIGLTLASRIPSAATGGVAMNPTAISVAEREPEAIIPLSAIYNFANRGPVTIQIFESQTPKETADEVILALRSKGII